MHMAKYCCAQLSLAHTVNRTDPSIPVVLFSLSSPLGFFFFNLISSTFNGHISSLFKYLMFFYSLAPQLDPIIIIKKKGGLVDSYTVACLTDLSYFVHLCTRQYTFYNHTCQWCWAWITNVLERTLEELCVICHESPIANSHVLQQSVFCAEPQFPHLQNEKIDDL